MNMTLKARMSAMICLFLAFTVGIGVLGLYGMNRSNAGLKTVYEDRTVSLQQLNTVNMYYTVTYAIEDNVHKTFMSYTTLTTNTSYLQNANQILLFMPER